MSDKVPFYDTFKYKFDKLIRKWTGYDFLVYDILHPFKRVLDWIPVIWKNYDFDHNYILILLQFKLKRMEPNMRCEWLVEELKTKTDWMEGEKEAHIRQIDTHKAIVRSIELLDRIIASPYMEEYDKMFIKHYGGLVKTELVFGKFEKGATTAPITFDHDYTAIDSNKLELAKKVNKRYSSVHHEWKTEQKDIEELFSLFGKHLTGWWS